MWGSPRDRSAGTDTIDIVALVGNDDNTMLDAFEQRLSIRHVVIIAARSYRPLDRQLRLVAC